MGAHVGLLIAMVSLPTLAILAALADRYGRQCQVQSNFNRVGDSRETFDVALRSALYHARLRGSLVLCMVIEMKPSGPNVTVDHAAQANLTYATAMLIKSFMRRRDRVCILGRNRYGVVLNAASDLTEDAALTMARRLKTDIEQGSTCRDQSKTGSIGAVIGVCVSPATGTVDAKTMIQTASSAVQAARETCAADVQLKPLQKPKKDNSKDTLYRDIVSAFDNEEICAWFQPQVCAKTGHVTGFESLARWVHPKEGVISPCAFLPILQRRGMMPLLQERMLKEALNGIEALRSITEDPPAVGINLSPEDLMDPTLPDRIEWELDNRNTAPRFLNIEILETVVARADDDLTTKNVKRLSDIGCRVDLDDFGTGHASISSLKRFALNRLKIDRSFISGMEDDPDKERMVAAILTMANQLDLDTLAEGVETKEQRTRLAELGCGHLQGFIIAQPMPLAEAVEWLSTQRAIADLRGVERAKAV